MSRPTGLKKFPPLHPATLEAIRENLKPIESGDLLGIRLSSRTLFNAEIIVGVALLIFESLNILEQDNDKAPNPTRTRHGAQTFGIISTIALLYADESFFDQVRHCILAVKNNGNLRSNDVDWLLAYCEAELESEKVIPPPPSASAVAHIKNNRNTKTAIPATVARDACRRLGLPLAKGSRGKKSSTE